MNNDETTLYRPDSGCRAPPALCTGIPTYQNSSSNWARRNLGDGTEATDRMAADERAGPVTVTATLDAPASPGASVQDVP